VRWIVALGAAVAVGLATPAGGAVAQAAAPPAYPAGSPAGRAAARDAAARSVTAPQDASVRKAYRFLNQMMDLYAAGTVPRLVQSYTGGLLGREHFTESVTYDDALVIDAYLAKGTAAALARAEVVGNGLRYVQVHDPRHDGRIRAGYAPVPLTSPGMITATDKTSDAGNMAWAGLALAQLYGASGRKTYLAGAEAVGNWVQAHCRDTRGPGGYTEGTAADGTAMEWKSTQHNIVLYALFTMLAAETGDRAWSARAAWARRFVAAMWDGPQHRFYVGTTADGYTPNNSQLPEDVNSWSYLALRDPAYASSLGWDVRNLAVTDGPFHGVSFCRGDRTGVWFEGTAHLADALELSGTAAARAQAATYLSGIRYAQASGPNSDGLGIIAASKNGLSDCHGGYYYASLHTGATAWYILAATRTDPFTPVKG
jgi:hypothetical protein